MITNKMTSIIRTIRYFFIVAFFGAILTCQAESGFPQEMPSGIAGASEQSVSSYEMAKSTNVEASDKNGNAENGNTEKGQPAVGFSFELSKPYPIKISVHFVDCSESVRNWGRDKLVPTIVTQLPRLIQMLSTEGYQPPSECTVIFKSGNGVAYTAGRTIVCFTPWFEQNLNGEAMGAFVHELTHWVQQYPGGSPGWLVEGLTDYIRWYKYEPKPIVAIDFRTANYTDSYRTTAAFLNYLALKVDPEIIQKLNILLRNGTYTDNAWSEITGKSAPELWNEFRKSELDAVSSH